MSHILHEAYKDLDSALTEAAINGKTGTRISQLSYPDLAASVNRRAPAGTSHHTLIVEITTYWADEGAEDTDA